MMDIEIDTESQHYLRLKNQIEVGKAMAKAMDENPSTVNNAVTHVMLGGILECINVLEQKLNFLGQQVSKLESPKIIVP